MGGVVAAGDRPGLVGRDGVDPVDQLHEQATGDRTDLDPVPGRRQSGGELTRRRFFFCLSASSASASKSGAATTSEKVSLRARAISSVTGRLDATMPP